MNPFQSSVIALLLCVLLTTPCLAQESSQYTLGNTHFKAITSSVGKKYQLVITLPGSYHSTPSKNYPVFYYLDAYWDTPTLFGVYHALVYDNLIPELILVGISYPGDNVDYGVERTLDLTPTHGHMPKNAAGGASVFLEFLKKSAVPFVEANYRTDKKKRALGGTSLGGLFTLFAMYQDPTFFARYIAISPAAVWDNNYLARRDALHAKSESLNARLFLSYGSEEYAPFRDPIRDFQKQLESRNYKNLALQNHHMKDLRHASVKAEGYTRGLIWIWKDVAPPGISGLEREFNVLPQTAE